MAWLADPSVIAPPQVCNGSLWDHIDHWEVVLTAVAIVVTWAVVNIARMYFMVQLAERRLADTGKAEPSDQDAR